ncbi:MAG: double-strand break repair helicase AddA [Phenylobacterium sp.]|jgi:ATP-dependent helicase/nuclease subunit A|nr:double-strand break repair helicase AddA [Phenylobacterium sp.]
MSPVIVLDIDPQRTAADPDLSAFVTANAGSGKTKTLIDRVARLLLAGAAPAAILCVTYTKAAAAEMQRRLFDLLGQWSVCDDAALRAALAKLEGRRPDSYDAARLSAARALFAQALETPGGLKIQTIHAFCEKLLRRFPLEAGISPGFRVMDDPAAALIARAARQAVARHALTGTGAVAQAYARLSVSLDFRAFEQMFATFEARRGALDAFVHRQGGLEGALAWIWDACGFDGEADPEAVAAAAMAELDRALWREAAEVLALGGKTDQSCAQTLSAVAADPHATLADALRALFTQGGEGTPATWVAKTKALAAAEPLRQALLDEQERLATARDQVRAANIAWDSAYVLVLAQAYLTAYAQEKAAAGALDFGDLIEKTRALVAERPMAAWVLYKLDGGIDHILLDEAQDTAPEQWEILSALTAEFFAGEGRERQALRSLFVVGDEKQSIYSFQGAAPERLRLETETYLARIRDAGARAQSVPLAASWRSTVDVLSFVDAVFSAPETQGGVPPARGEDAVRHIPMRRHHRGCVDLWPLEREPEGEEREAWDAPLDVEGPASANRRLAENIACEIEDLVARGDGVFDKDLDGADGTRGAWRPASYGDVLILVRRRKALFEDILRALKRRGVPVAGADRLALSEHIIFDDLLAVARFVLFPQDELNLAALLKSPFCGLDDEALYALAKPRKPGDLWSALQARAAERPDWGHALAFLTAAQAEARTRRPFEFYGRLMTLRDDTGASMRQRIVRRLGTEAEDALDEFLAQAQAAEQRGICDLEGLADALAGLNITVKREMEAARNEVRVMTAHGAKGLEAPIVFLPETTLSGLGRGSPLLETEDGGFLWCPSKTLDCAASTAARDLRARKDEEEAYRLLYVALTRARDRLVICGRIAAKAKEENLKGWWAAIQAGFAHEGVGPHLRPAACGQITAQRFGEDPQILGRGAADDEATAPLPDWARVDAAADPLARFASPSDLGEAEEILAPSPLARVGGLGRFRRGELIHRLLQILPDLALDDREAAATAILAREPDLTEDQRAEMAGAALAVLADPLFADVFSADGRAEVAIAGTAAALPKGLQISGRIDRLVVRADKVLVADFKTNRPSPARIEDADPAYIRQMAVYAAVLAEVFPGRAIEAALVWTDGPKLMAVPEFLMAQALADLRSRS